MSEITDNTAESRFEMIEDGHLAFADYRRKGDTLIFPHVEAAQALRGSGAAGRLMEGVLEKARAEGLKVVPLCSFAAAFMKRHKEYDDLLA